MDQTVPLKPVPLPYSQAVLVLGIISASSCWLWGIPGLATGIPALVLWSRCRKSWYASDGQFLQSSFNSARAGMICALAGTIISGILLIYLLAVLLIFGAVLSVIPVSEWFR